MANILRIPSVVLVGDYRDPFRDDHFINPYVEDGHMKVVKFKDIDKVNPDEVVSLLNL
jgi:ADP-heptose:LPS heptosyltransferase